jgi:hypothetical protein
MTAAIGLGMIGIFMLEETGRKARGTAAPLAAPATI